MNKNQIVYFPTFSGESNRKTKVNKYKEQSVICLLLGGSFRKREIISLTEISHIEEKLTLCSIDTHFDASTTDSF